MFKKNIFFLFAILFNLPAGILKWQKLPNENQLLSAFFRFIFYKHGKTEPVFTEMPDPFYAVDSRDYQVVQPDQKRLKETGSKILCIEKERPHVPYERAVMGIRFTDYFIGTQFHPEADAVGMKLHLQSEEKKKTVIENYGREKWESMIEKLNDPDKIVWTHDHIIPNFLKLATDQLMIDRNGSWPYKQNLFYNSISNSNS